MGLARLFGVIMIFLMFASFVRAEALPGEHVEGFVNAMKDLKPYFDQYADEIGDDGDASSTAKLVTDWASGLKRHADLMEILEKHGFDEKSWVAVTPLVMKAYMTVKLGAEGRNIPAQMAESLKEIESNPDIPEAQKTEIRDSIQRGIEEFEKSLDAPIEHQDAIRPYLGQLDEIFEWQE